MKQYILSAIFLLSLGGALAQNCSQKLEDATRAYYNGKFREVSELLEGCLNSLTRDQKNSAYKLLTDTHLVLGETEAADTYLRELLRVNPDFKPRESDLVELKNLYDRYKIVSRFSFGFSLGVQRPDYKIIKHQSFAGVTKEPADYREFIGYFMGISAEVLLLKNIYLSTGLYYDHRGFEQEEIILGLQRINSKEREHRINVPLQLKYIYPSRSIQPFVAAGYSYHYLYRAVGDMQQVQIEPAFEGTTIGVPYAVDKYDLTNLRTRSTFNSVVSTGAQLRLQRGFLLECKMTYEHGFSNLTNESNRYRDITLLEHLAYVPDDFKVSSWMFSVSILKNYSKPIKK